ncbi:Rut operon repressor [Tritonibacter multivorans]|uniref:Rut operon repressor n=1 Tax=Tritonibacter multivorans TaxID=928856 RepID=A0A0P1GIU1_9RHOB|nr:TetR family transcriptional regulator C-terminal domain-containing protein [Tritonibacter multivorans]MDA7420532.1 TetR family transcriptional regulator C-terminal domain-containing protein [Tritonibacter multivorans]CUH81408.1 Rut operon repressor [Tritonibacter multivorans]SFC34929.1 transcriptional regulator, TetR family [Tritonibacter multivorans]
MTTSERSLTRIQKRNRAAILEAALDVFSQNGFRGATVDQIAKAAGLSKPNLLYYFPSKEEIFTALLSQLLDSWLAPLRDLNADGEPLEEILQYTRRKLEMSREMPRESRLFANELVQGAPRMIDQLSTDLRVLVDDTVMIFETWMTEGKLARVHPRHLLFSIWSLTQHYADFDVQVRTLMAPDGPMDGAEEFLENLYRKMLTPAN